jgi:hypothetical protein
MANYAISAMAQHFETEGLFAHIVRVATFMISVIRWARFFSPLCPTTQDIKARMSDGVTASTELGLLSGTLEGLDLTKCLQLENKIDHQMKLINDVQRLFDGVRKDSLLEDLANGEVVSWFAQLDESIGNILYGSILMHIGTRLIEAIGYTSLPM